MRRIVIVFALVLSALTVPRYVHAETTLQVSTKPLPPFVNDQWKGLSIDLWNAVANRLGVKTSWTHRTSVDEILADVQQRHSDVAIAGISMTPRREQAIDFSHPYYDSGLQILARKGTGGSFLQTLRSQNLLRPVVIFFLITVLMAHVVWLVERRYDADFPKRYFKGIWEAFFWSITTVTTGGDAEKSIHRPITRVVAMLWMFTGLFITAWLTATVTSQLTVQGLRASIKGVQDLPGKRVVTVKGTTAEQYLLDNNIQPQTVATIDAAYPLVESKQADALVYDAPVLRYWLASHPAKLALAGALFKPDKYAIALQAGSPWREKVDEALLELQADGTTDRLTAKWFGVQTSP